MKHLFIRILQIIVLIPIHKQCYSQCIYNDPVISRPTSGYGADGTHPIDSILFTNPYFPTQKIRIYYPSDITGHVPTIFYSHAYGGYDPAGICGLYKFVAKKGYAFVFVPYQTLGVTVTNRYDNLLNGFQTAARNYPNIIDTSKVGFLGWSFGGGASFATAYTTITQNNWGQNGRFIYALAQWYSYNISQSQLQTFPSNTNLLTEVFDDDVTNDHRMAIDIFNNISIPAARKNFLLVKSDTLSGHIYTANHTVPNTSNAFDAYDYYAYYRLLDALCDYSFNGNTTAQNIALGNGSTAQVTMPGGLKKLIAYSNPPVLYPQDKYEYPCNDTQNLRTSYCLPQTATSISNPVAPSPSIQLYPNPASHSFNLQINGNIPDGSQLSIVNQLGQVILKQTFKSDVDINVSYWQAGIYYVRVDNGQQLYTGSILITH